MTIPTFHHHHFLHVYLPSISKPKGTSHINFFSKCPHGQQFFPRFLLETHWLTVAGRARQMNAKSILSLFVCNAPPEVSCCVTIMMMQFSFWIYFWCRFVHGSTAEFIERFVFMRIAHASRTSFVNDETFFFVLLFRVRSSFVSLSENQSQ